MLKYKLKIQLIAFLLDIPTSLDITNKNDVHMRPNNSRSQQ